MTEDDVRRIWLNGSKADCRTPGLRELHHNGVLDDRLLRLFGAACLIDPVRLSPDEINEAAQNAQLVRIAECLADGDETGGAEIAFSRPSSAQRALRATVRHYPIEFVVHASAYGGCGHNAKPAKAQAEVLIDMIGPGWVFLPEWRTSTVTSLAQRIYDEKEWDLLPILGDALQDAGMGIGHPAFRTLVEDGIKFRGMWVLDKLTGKR